MKAKENKRSYPWGIFSACCISLIIFSAAVSALYFFVSAKSGIDEIEMYTRKYASAIAAASADVAELSYAQKNCAALKRLFQEKITQNLIDEAFFILDDGKIMAHSSAATEKMLDGNVANDEFRYNIDLLLLPLTKKTRDVIFINYNILNREIPFTPREKMLIKRYIYRGINSVGWLATKVVYSKGKGVGTVNFIIGKERIYTLLETGAVIAAKMFAALAALSVFFSIVASMLVYIRYRPVKKPFRVVKPSTAGEAPATQAVAQDTEVTHNHEAPKPAGGTTEIRDAIPISR